jgi:hypothetical protein
METSTRLEIRSTRRQFLKLGAATLALPYLQGLAPAQVSWSSVIDLMYYPWYGGPNEGYQHWGQGGRRPESGDIAANFFPKRWPYSSKDEKLLRWHCKLIRRMGVRQLALSYWGRGSYTEEAIAVLMRLLPEYGLQAIFHIESFAGRNQGFRFKEEIHYLANRYGNHPAFYRDNGQPLFYVWAAHLPPTQHYADHFISDGHWQRMLDELRGELGPLLFLAQSTDIGRAQLGHFSGLYLYGPFFTPQQILDTVKNARQIGLITSASVSPGYDDRRALRDPSRPTIARDQGRYYLSMWQSALAAQPNRINITSFNEWHEGTQIEPARRTYRDQPGYSNYSPLGVNSYLDETRRQIEALQF